MLRHGRKARKRRGPGKHSSAIRLQSAMEYLMTYGWAILIIAVVLGALYQLGIFGSATSGPRAIAGSCTIFRPNGPGTALSLSLVGQCNQELPQYVGVFVGSASVSLPASPLLQPSSQITVSMWVSTNAILAEMIPMYMNPDYLFATDSSPPHRSMYWEIHVNSVNQLSNSPAINVNQWYHVVGTYDGSNVNLYINGVFVSNSAASGSITYSSGSDHIIINEVALPAGMQAYLSNLQVYNSSLSASEVKSLYLEGIGGAPVKPQNLVGWWPLNGDVKDYSGDLNNGVPNGVTFTSTWENGYTPP